MCRLPPFYSCYIESFYFLAGPLFPPSFLYISSTTASTRETLAAAGQKVIHLSMVSSSHGYFSSYTSSHQASVSLCPTFLDSCTKRETVKRSSNCWGKRKMPAHLSICWPVYYVLSPFRNRWKTVVNCWCQSIGNDLVIHSSNKLQETKEKFVS